MFCKRDFCSVVYIKIGLTNKFKIILNNDPFNNLVSESQSLTMNMCGCVMPLLHIFSVPLFHICSLLLHIKVYRDAKKIPTRPAHTMATYLTTISLQKKMIDFILFCFGFALSLSHQKFYNQ